MGVFATTATGMHFDETINFTGVGTFDDFYFSDEIVTITSAPFALGDMPAGDSPIYTSEEFDLLAAPTAWGVLALTQDLNGFSVLCETNVSSTSGSGFDGWVALDGG